MLRLIGALCICCFGSLSCRTLEAAFVFDDGGTHIVNYTINDYVVIFDSFPGGLPTTVIIQDPASVTGDFFDDSVIVEDTSLLYLEGGTIANDVAGYGISDLFVSGGVVGDDLQAFEGSYIEVTGGTVVDDVESYDAGLISIFDGDFGEDIEAIGGTILISGGNFATNGTDALDSGFGAGDGGEIVFFAAELFVDGVRQTPGALTATSGLLSGTFENGSTFTDIPFDADLGGPAGTITFFAVPEPSSLLFLLSTALPLAFRRRRTI